MINTSCFSSRGAKIYKKVPLSTNKQIKGPFSRTTITIILSFFLSLLLFTQRLLLCSLSLFQTFHETGFLHGFRLFASNLANNLSSLIV